jgi:hypothetical protein
MKGDGQRLTELVCSFASVTASRRLVRQESHEEGKTM